jgi:chromosome segregation ATPase
MRKSPHTSDAGNADPEVAIVELHAEIDSMIEEIESTNAERNDAVANLELARKETAQTRVQVAELKERLVRAELNVHWLRGYVARVREDDVASEELVTTGNEDELTLVPKRKFEPLPRDYHDADQRGGDSVYVSRTQSPPPKRKHWVNY